VNTHRCCEAAANGSRFERVATPTKHGGTHPLTFARRSLQIAGWIVPGTILALMPKCPACLAAYVAIGTGLGLSLSTATRLRASLLLLCVALLLYLAVRRLGRFLILKKALLGAKSPIPTIQAKEIAR
jgi:hypothetical protein